MGKNTEFAQRMKDYEACYGFKVPSRSYVIVRLDGVGFSQFTKNFNKPFDDNFSNAMDYATIELCKKYHPKFAYTQSDEISLLFTNIDNIDSELIYEGKIQKMGSIFASTISTAFNNFMLKMAALKYSPEELSTKIINDELKEIKGTFDARVFVIPDITEVYNYFVWRQKDCTRNSISMAAHTAFGDSATKNKSGNQKQEMLFTEKGINWNDYKIKYKRGSVIKKIEVLSETEHGIARRSKWVPDYETPEFTKDREYLQKLVPISK